MTKLHQVEQMIRSIGDFFILNLFSNSKWVRDMTFLIKVMVRIIPPCGPLLVSRIGDAGCTESGPMVPKHLLIRSHEGRWFI